MALQSIVIADAPSSVVPSVDSVATLRATRGYKEGSTINVTSYYAGYTATANGPMGGGLFVFNSASTSADDGVINFACPNGVWSRVLVDKVVNLHQCGLVADGTDETTRLAAAVSALAAITGYVLDGLGKTVVKSSGLVLDVVKMGLRNIKIQDTTSTSTTPYYALTLEGTALANRQGKGPVCVFERVSVIGAVSRNGSAVHGVLVKPTVDLSQANFVDCHVRQFNCGLVLSSNTYLITFHNWHISNCFTCLGTTLWTGTVSTNLTNAGENLRFAKCTFADSNQVGRLAGIEAFITFDACSFDYTGASTAFSYVQWDGFRNGTQLLFQGCHFESGNANDSWGGIYFNIPNGVFTAITIIGGCMRHSNTYNACPYFFYDAGSYGQFSLIGTDIHGLGVLQWSNRGMYAFYPTVNAASTFVRGYLSDKSDLVTDPEFSKLSGAVSADNWQVVDGDRSAALTSSVLSCATANFTDASGTTRSCLKVTKLTQSSAATLRLYVRRPNSAYGPLGGLKLCSDSAVTPSGVVSLSTGVLKTRGLVDAYGLPVPDLLSAKVTTTIASISDSFTQVQARGVLTYGDVNNGWDYMFLSLNLGGLSAGTSVYITDINLEIPKR